MTQPARIASLLASGTEILYGLGLGPRVVAVSHECDFPPEVSGKPRATFAHVDSAQSSRTIDDQVKHLASQGAALYEIDEELLVRLQPDLIVTQAQCDVCAVRYDDVIGLVNAHDELQATQVVALNPQTLEDIFADITRVGDAAGVGPAAQQFVASLRARVASVQAKSAQLTDDVRPRVVCIEWIEPLMLGANWMPGLVRLAGGRYDLVQHEGHSTYGQWADVRRYDPEVIIVMPCGFDLTRTITESNVLAKLDGWQDLAAVKADAVFAVDGNAYFNRSGPRMVDSLEILAHLIHPSRFELPAHVRLAQNVWRRLRTHGATLVPEAL